jgi:hypothetical protein
MSECKPKTTVAEVTFTFVGRNREEIEAHIQEHFEDPLIRDVLAHVYHTTDSEAEIVQKMRAKAEAIKACRRKNQSVSTRED